MKNIYFIGIGGIGMSAIARYYNVKGYAVSGYDKTPSPLTHALEDEGIGDDADDVFTDNCYNRFFHTWYYTIFALVPFV